MIPKSTLQTAVISLGMAIFGWWLGDFTWKQFVGIFFILWGNNVALCRD